MQTEPTAKRIRAVLGGRIALDSVDVLLVWEVPYYPQYYVPVDDVVATLESTGDWDDAPGDLGSARRHDVVSADGTRAVGAGWDYPDHPDLAGRIRFDWDSFESWFEEDEMVFVHPRSPYVRVDTLHSSREIRVEVDGETIAHSTRPTLLLETGLPTRYYLPATDVCLDLLRPSDTVSSCPYKGDANYHSVEVNGRLHEDIVWYYRTPARESAPIAGLLCFYNEKVDISVDGVDRGRPRTKFS